MTQQPTSLIRKTAGSTLRLPHSVFLVHDITDATVRTGLRSQRFRQKRLLAHKIKGHIIRIPGHDIFAYLNDSFDHICLAVSRPVRQIYMVVFSVRLLFQRLQALFVLLDIQAVIGEKEGMTAREISEVFHGKERKPEDNYSIGLENVFSRLKLNFKEAASLEIESEPGH